MAPRIFALILHAPPYLTVGGRGAQAHYKRQLTSFNKAFLTFASSYDNVTADSRYRAETMGRGSSARKHETNAFKAKAKRYFATAKQQRLFKKRCGLLKSYASSLMWLDAPSILGQDPPAFEASAKALEDGDADAATGHEGWDKQRAALRGML